MPCRAKKSEQSAEVLQLKVLSVSTYDGQGGAAKAAYRLHDGLRRIGADAHFFVRDTSSRAPFVTSLTQRQNALSLAAIRLESKIDQLPLQAYKRRQPDNVWSLNWFPFPGLQAIQNFDAQLIQLHWIW